MNELTKQQDLWKLPPLLVTEDKATMSVYADPFPSDKDWRDNCTLIKKIYPDLPSSWFDGLKYMVKQKGFTRQRLSDAVTHMIANCKYPKPTPAEILSFDKSIEMLTPTAYYRRCDEYSIIPKQYKAINVQDKMFFAHVEDIKRYGLSEWVPLRPKYDTVTYENKNTDPEAWSGFAKKALGIIEEEKTKEQEPAKLPERSYEEIKAEYLNELEASGEGSNEKN